jgi:phosphate transport system protein
VWFQVKGEPLSGQRDKRDLTSSPEPVKLGNRPE